MKKTTYVYLTEKDFDNTVFVTQVADWLNLYKEFGVEFVHLHAFFYRSLIKKGWRQKQITGISNSLLVPYYFSVAFPSRGLFVYINAMLWYWKIKHITKDSEKVVLMSRNIYGKEIAVLRKLLKLPLHFIYDARAASVEENIYNAVKRHGLSKKQYDVFRHISYTEFCTVQQADTIFAVSNQLKRYLIRNYDVAGQKFFIYPCLSDANKFYYNSELRQSIRKDLGFDDSDAIFLYAGGLANLYHGTDTILGFINQVALKQANAKFLLLSRDRLDEQFVKQHYPALLNRLLVRSALNNEMVNYYNAADFGLLLRENVPMNNVASPSKFAEYMLCGLPAIISEGVGDYSEICEKEHLGVVVKEDEMNNPLTFDTNAMTGYAYTEELRKRIADFGYAYFSKQAKLDDVIRHFKLAGAND